MRNLSIGSILSLAAVLVFSEVALAQTTDITPGPGWLAAIRRHSDEAQAADRVDYKIDEQTLDPYDLSGMWGENGIRLNRDVPPFTPYGQELSL